jgi:long-chain fatty acid transport protein
MRNSSHRRWLVAVGLLLAPTLAFGSGFALFEHGARGVAMGGAFGAIADDATAGYYNPAGLAFQEDSEAIAGAYFIGFNSDFTGDNPYPGEGYTASQEEQIFYPLHMHTTGEISDTMRWGFSLTAPFGLGTWWPNDFAGKFISKRIDLKVLNFNPNLAIKLSDSFAVAVGFDYFMSQVDLTKSIGVVNPYTQQVAEVGQVHMYNEWDGGWGYNAALLAKFGSFSVGAGYRSRVEVTYDAEASFVQFPSGYDDFDQIVAGLIPFEENVAGETRINFPAEMRLGAAWQGETFTVSADVVKMGWDSFQSLPIILEGYPLLSSDRPQNYKDTYTYRMGVEFKSSDKWAWQFGALYDETPVPTPTVSPMLPDSDRTGISVGFSYNLSDKMSVDVGFLHLMFDERSTEGMNSDDFNGTYKQTAELLGVSMGYRF